MKLKLKGIDLHREGNACDEEFDVVKHYSCDYNKNIEDIYELRDQYNETYYLFRYADDPLGQWEISDNLFGVPIATGTAEVMELIK